MFFIKALHTIHNMNPDLKSSFTQCVFKFANKVKCGWVFLCNMFGCHQVFSLEVMGRDSLLQKFSVFNMFIGSMDTQEQGYSVRCFHYLLDYNFIFFYGKGKFLWLVLLEREQAETWKSDFPSLHKMILLYYQFQDIDT